MNILKRSFAVILTLQVLCGSLLVLSQEVEAEAASTTYSQQEILIEINSYDALETIKQVAIEDFITYHKLSIYDFNLEESELIIDQLDVTKVSAQRINLLIHLKPINQEAPLLPKTISAVYNVSIIDTQSPELELFYDTLQIRRNSDFDPMSAVKSVTDNSKIDYFDNVYVTGEIDTSVLGSTTLTYHVMDDSKNETIKTLFVQTKDYSNALGGFSQGDDIQTMLALINETRARHGLNPLELADENGQIAGAIRAQESIGNITHRRPDGSHYKTALSEQGVSWQRSPLEILTYAGRSIQGSLNWWMNSPGHRSILLQPSYKIIAIGKSGSMWAAILY